jgi:two-component system cell cycle response regulator
VEDEEDVRSTLCLALSEKYEVVEAHDGLDALQKLEWAEPDFVILDVMMPLMDGFEACRAIRNHPGFRDVPVLFLSAKTESEALKEGYGAGANLYLTKPYDPFHLAATVEYFLGKSGATPRPKRCTLDQVRGTNANQTPVPVETPAPADQPAALVPRVMIVDSDPAVVASISGALAKDFEITWATSSLEAIQKAMIHGPDLVVIDAKLPRESGPELCVLLRRNDYYRSTPIILASPKPSERDKEYYRRLGATDCIAKPYDPEALRQKLLDCSQAPGFAVRHRNQQFEMRFPTSL